MGVSLNRKVTNYINIPPTNLPLYSEIEMPVQSRGLASLPQGGYLCNNLKFTLKIYRVSAKKVNNWFAKVRVFELNF